MHHIVHHDLSLDLAKRTVEHAMGSYAERLAKYEPKVTWLSDVDARIDFSVRGVHLEGQIQLGEGQIALGLEVPFVFRVFRDRAIRVIEQEIRTWIAKAKSGDITPESTRPEPSTP